MEVVTIIVTILLVLCGLAVILAVLFQSGKSAGLSGTIGGVADTFMAKGKAKSFDAKLAKATKWIGAVFILLTLVLSWNPPPGGRRRGSRRIRSIPLPRLSRFHGKMPSGKWGERLMKMREAVKNTLLAAAIFLLALVLSILIQTLGVREHVTTVFVFAVFLISLLTEGYVYGVVSAVAGTLAVNYAFTYPYFTLNFTVRRNLISAVIMVTIAVLTGMLTTRVKQHKAAKAESEKERMRANLLRAVSHDLRTPLTTIYSASSTLLDKREQLTDQQRDLMLKSIQEDSEWLVRMVENLLSITRIGSERIEIAKTPVILDELIDSAMTKFHSRYPGQEVALELPEDMVAIPVDAILIEQVLINLLENAVLHAEGMTTLSLRVFTLGRQAIFEVADNGCGIREDRLSHIFSGSYEALESTPDGRKRNAGIGLSVCATIIKAHGGEITAENRRGGGALFRFTLGKEDITDDE